MLSIWQWKSLHLQYQDLEITGLKVGVEEFKLKGYADDAVLTITNNQKLMQRVTEEIQKFGSFSGYKIN